MQQDTLFDTQDFTAWAEQNPCVLLYGPGPEGTICRSCVHLVLRTGRKGRRWWKCTLRRSSTGRTYLGGPVTDHRCRWHTCARYQERGVF